YYGQPASTRRVEARSNGASWGRNAIAAAVQHAVVAEDWTSRRRPRPTLGVLRRVKDRLQYVQPACDGGIATDRGDQEVAGARGSYVGNSYGFSSVATQFLVRGLQELDWRAATEWFKPPPPNGVDMPAGYITRHLAGRISKDDYWKLQSLRLVDRH